jgi:CubicO group peptidase (beta-lactamase class C family)
MIREWIGNLAGKRVEQELDALVKAYTDQGKFSGAVLVARGDEVLLRKGYGIANLEHDIPNRPETVFRIGSMTKPFTAIAVMQLVETGQLAVNDPISKYLPDFPNGERITLHHLLSNTSGIPDYVITSEYQKISKNHITTQDLIALFRDKPLQFEPGTDFGYSNSNWVLLGAILEQVTGKTYSEVIRERIFELLGMTHSGYEWEQPVIKNRAWGYVDRGAGILNAELIDESTMQGAGGLYSTVDDLYRWERALHDGTLVRDETVKQMSTPVFKGYGYGWELYSLHNRRVVAHSGGLPGYVSNFVRFVDDDAAIIILSNLGSAAFPQMTEVLAAIAFGEPYQMPSAYTFVAVDPTILADYVGEYSVTFFGRTSILKFALEGDKLVMSVQGLPKSILSGISETTFYTRSKGEVEMTFVRDGAGRVNAIDMNWAGHLQTAARVK